MKDAGEIRNREEYARYKGWERGKRDGKHGEYRRYGDTGGMKDIGDMGIEER